MILGICGSGRKESNTAALIDAVLKAAGGPAELIWLIDINLGYCTGCMRCAFEGACWQQDGMTGLYQKLIEADAIVFGSPCYHGTVSGLFKSFMDRSIALNYMGIGKEADNPILGRKPLAGKPAVLVSAVASHGVDRTLQVMEGFVSHGDMNIVGKLGAAAGMGDVRDKPDILEQARALGVKLAQVLKK